MSVALADYVSLLGTAEIDELRALAEALKPRRVLMVNSTAVGGGRKNTGILKIQTAASQITNSASV